MRRYWIEKHNLLDDQVNFDGELFHHIVDVCRVNIGQKFEVLLDGIAYLVEMKQISKKQATAVIVEKRTVAQLSKPHIHLMLSLPKFSRADLIVEKSVELGVSSITPFVSENSFVRKLSKIQESKILRWEKIIISATQQSGRGELMQVHPPSQLSELLKSMSFDEYKLGVVPYEGDCNENLKQFSQRIKTSELTDLYVFIGSEGGFSQQEVRLFQSAGIQPVTVGEQVLRVETACISVVSMLNYEFHL